MKATSAIGILLCLLAAGPRVGSAEPAPETALNVPESGVPTSAATSSPEPRDPFWMVPDPPACEGLECRRIDEVRLAGISRMGEEGVALLTVDDRTTFFARRGDLLKDGLILGVDFEGERVLFRKDMSEGLVPSGTMVVERKLNP